MKTEKEIKERLKNILERKKRFPLFSPEYFMALGEINALRYMLQRENKIHESV